MEKKSKRDRDTKSEEFYVERDTEIVKRRDRYMERHRERDRVLK